MSETQSNNPAVVKALSVNEIFDKKTTKDHLNKDLILINGIVDDKFFHMTKYGESTGFKGVFFFTNLLTGEVKESQAAFLPKGLTAKLAEQVDNNPNMEIELKDIAVRAIESDKNREGYAWVAEKPMTETKLSYSEQMRQKTIAHASKLQIEAPKAKTEAKASK